MGACNNSWIDVIHNWCSWFITLRWRLRLRSVADRISCVSVHNIFTIRIIDSKCSNVRLFPIYPNSCCKINIDSFVGRDDFGVVLTRCNTMEIVSRIWVNASTRYAWWLSFYSVSVLETRVSFRGWCMDNIVRVSVWWFVRWLIRGFWVDYRIPVFGIGHLQTILMSGQNWFVAPVGKGDDSPAEWSRSIRTFGVDDSE